MQQVYSLLLTFMVQHRYFRDNLFHVADISFAEGTAKLINDLGIVIKPFKGGFYLLCSDPELLKGEQRSIRLNLNCQDTQYINYSDLPSYQPRTSLLYFDNQIIPAGSNDESLLLHEDLFVSVKDIVQVTHGKLTIPNFDQGKEYRFTDAIGDELHPGRIQFSANNPNEVTLLNLPEGLVRVYSGDEEIERVYHQPKAIWTKPMGIIEIYAGELYNQYKKKEQIDYAVQFNYRQTIWKYFVVSPVYQKFNNLSIVNKGKEQIFNAPQKQRILQNQEALVFESKDRIPLLEQSGEIYQLVDNYDPELPAGKVILKNLAKASPEQLYYDTTVSDAPAYSHIYI